MIEEKTNLFKFRKMAEEAVEQKDYVLERNKRAYKLDMDCVNASLERFFVPLNTSSIKPEQIQWLSDKARYIEHSWLPSGILYTNFNPVAVIYPYYFKDYKDFNELYTEDSKVIFRNLRRALLNNRELLNNDIYQTDLSFKNIIYKGKDVQLIDLDGRYVKPGKWSNYDQVYQDYLIDLKRLVKNKLNLLYGEDADKAFEEVKHLFEYKEGIEIDYPFDLIDELELKKVLK